MNDVWYEVRTTINNREPLFRQRQAVKVFCWVFGEARGRFVFELRGFRLDGERLSFYIKPENGLQLPAIMQWVKQTFAVRFNRRTKRTGTSGETGIGRGCWKVHRQCGGRKWTGKRWRRWLRRG
jgi:hypothetical protein